MGNPLEPDVEARANALGKLGWELVAIDAGVWIFKRASLDTEEPHTELEAILEQTVPLAEPAPTVTTVTTVTPLSP